MLAGIVLNGLETSEINQNFCGIYKSVVISMNFEIAEFLFKHY